MNAPESTFQRPKTLTKWTEMLKLTVLITWDAGIERVELDTSIPLEPGDFLYTHEDWGLDKGLYRYRTRCESFEWSNDILRLVLVYRRENNLLLADETSSLWGRSTIEVNIPDKSATADWVSDDDASLTGRAEACTVENWTALELVVPVYKQFWGIYRPEQQAIRLMLLRQDPTCAITGEVTIDALDLAHIIDVSLGGGYSLGNCMLLRTDLHRLFDRDLLTISTTGELEFTGEISKSYRDALSGKRLNEEVLIRVSAALTARAELRGR